MRTSALLLALAAVFVAASAAQATTQLLVDRGLTSNGVNNTDWGLRSNIAEGNYDPKDSLADPTDYGPPGLEGDDFTLPSAGGQAYRITDVRVWVMAYGHTAYNDMFNSMTLLLGPSGSTLATVPVVPTVTQVTYPGGQKLRHDQRQLYLPRSTTQ